jgi:hypothetical protein
VLVTVPLGAEIPLSPLKGAMLPVKVPPLASSWIPWA